MTTDGKKIHLTEFDEVITICEEKCIEVYYTDMFL